MSTKEAIVFYHANCADGFGAAFAFHTLAARHFDSVEYVPINYGTDPKTLNLLFEGKSVYILDFSFSRAELKELCELASEVHLYDHHLTAEQELGNWEDEDNTDFPKNLEAVIDKGSSGATLAWEMLALDFIPGGHIDTPMLLRYVEDRDLWKWKLNGSKEVSAVIALTEQTFEAWQRLSILIQHDPASVIVRGRDLLLQRQQLVEQLAANSFPINIGGHNGLAANCPGAFASELGELLSIQSGSFGATFNVRKDGAISWSLRSRSDFDVAALAKSYGGGGHKNAAGFTTDVETGVMLWQGK